MLQLAQNSYLQYSQLKSLFLNPNAAQILQFDQLERCLRELVNKTITIKEVPNNEILIQEALDKAIQRVLQLQNEKYELQQDIRTLNQLLNQKATANYETQLGTQNLTQNIIPQLQQEKHTLNNQIQFLQTQFYNQNTELQNQRELLNQTSAHREHLEYTIQNLRQSQQVTSAPAPESIKLLEQVKILSNSNTDLVQQCQIKDNMISQLQQENMVIKTHMETLKQQQQIQSQIIQKQNQQANDLQYQQALTKSNLQMSYNQQRTQPLYYNNKNLTNDEKRKQQWQDILHLEQQLLPVQTSIQQKK